MKFGDVQMWFDLMIGLFQSEDMRLNKEMLFKILKQREGEKKEWVAEWELETMSFDTKAMGYDDIPEEKIDQEDSQVRF